MDIELIDKNFFVPDKIERDGIEYINALDLTVNGVMVEDGRFTRMPTAVAKSVSPAVENLNFSLAGGRVRFITDSPYIAVCVYLNTVCKMGHFPFTGSVGMDLYSGKRYYGTFIPPFSVESSYSAVIDLDGKMREYTINLPLYSGIDQLYIGYKGGCVMEKAKPYKIEKPVVFYGSSITQGGCASHAGSAYENIISRELDCDIINFGFSGNAKGETTMAEHIASLDMSAFVLDYDHNADFPQDLQQTHERFFQIVRKAHPTVPIIMLTRPQPYLNKDEKLRKKIVKTTYLNALNSGDNNVYFIPGDKFFPDIVKNMALVDNCHPNDCGFYFMAKAVLRTLKKVLG